jgi:membrane fusion protein, multidrug efflux system
MKKKIIYALMLIVLVAGIAWKLSSNKKKIAEKTELATQKSTIFPVAVVNPKMESISQDFEIPGSFRPLHEVNLVPDVAGRVVSVLVKNGDNVTKGQLIAKLDNEQVSYDIAAAEAAFQKAENDLQRFETMAKSEAVTPQQLADIRLAYKNAQSRLSVLQKQSRNMSIVAPISGTINSLTLEVGSYVTPGNPFGEIVDISRLKMNAKLSDAEAFRVQKGQEVKVKADLYSTAEYKGVVNAVAAKADASRKYDTEIELVNSKDHPVKAGMTGSVYFAFEGNKTALVIPRECLAGASLQDPKVYIVKDSIARLVPISIGMVKDDKVEVLKGITEKDAVVRSGQLNLSEGSKVQIIK